MKQPWLSNTLLISTIYAFRMLGLFMLIPVFTVYAMQLHAATLPLMGIALGCYGFSQSLFQIPFGLLSDRYGRKPILVYGLILFAIGSLMGALTHSIYGMILARTVQGAGAIGSVLIALLADLTPDKQRTKAMAVIGVTIAISFSLALIISPIITQRFGLAGIFYFSTLCAVLGLIFVYCMIPTPPKEPFKFDRLNYFTQFKRALTNRHLQRLNAGIFCQHLILISTFFAIPLILRQQQQSGHITSLWHFYLPLMIGAFLIMTPFIMHAEKKQRIKGTFLSSIFLIALTQILLAFFYQNWIGICALMLVYFAAFNILEASLPSLASRQANADNKGTAMGIYSSSQFLGIFAGGALSGIIDQFYGYSGIFIFNGIMALIWLIIAVFMQPYAYQLTLMIPFDTNHMPTESLIEKIRALPGVQQVAMMNDESIICLRVEKSHYQEGSVEELIKALVL